MVSYLVSSIFTRISLSTKRMEVLTGAFGIRLCMCVYLTAIRLSRYHEIWINVLTWSRLQRWSDIIVRISPFPLPCTNGGCVVGLFAVMCVKWGLLFIEVLVNSMPKETNQCGCFMDLSEAFDSVFNLLYSK